MKVVVVSAHPGFIPGLCAVGSSTGWTTAASGNRPATPGSTSMTASVLSAGYSGTMSGSGST